MWHPRLTFFLKLYTFFRLFSGVQFKANIRGKKLQILWFFIIFFIYHNSPAFSPVIFFYWCWFVDTSQNFYKKINRSINSNDSFWKFYRNPGGGVLNSFRKHLGTMNTISKIDTHTWRVYFSLQSKSHFTISILEWNNENYFCYFLSLL